MSTDKKHNLTVFYDGECPYCHTEIKWYRKLDKAMNIDWVDITQDQSGLNDHGINYDRAMAELYVISADGQQHVGVAGFLTIWAQLPFYRRLSSFLKRVPFIVSVLNKMYRKFTVWRIKQKNHRQQK